MTLKPPPYFMTNPEWFKLNTPPLAEGQRRLELTDKAPKKAIESYEEFYGEWDTAPKWDEGNFSYRDN